MSGRIKLRSRPVERTWARVLREAGGRVRDSVLLRDTAQPDIDPADRRQIEIVVTGLACARGLPVAVDATFVSPVHADGAAWPKADLQPGISFQRARRAKLKAYPELENSHSLHLVVAATEVGGRLSQEGM